AFLTLDLTLTLTLPSFRFRLFPSANRPSLRCDPETLRGPSRLCGVILRRTFEIAAALTEDGRDQAGELKVFQRRVCFDRDVGESRFRLEKKLTAARWAS